MTRPRTMRKMTGEVAGLLGMVPASVEGSGLAFLHGDLRSALSIWKGRYDRTVFGWMVITYDTALHDQMKGVGGMGIRIDHPPVRRTLRVR